MARKPENTFRESVHKYLPKNLYHEKMSNPYLSGTPDDWYSGKAADLWLEYKYLPTIPKRKIIKPYELLSALQLRWLNDRYTENRNVGVCIGCPEGGVLLRNKEWLHEISAEEFCKRLSSRKEIAQDIVLITST